MIELRVTVDLTTVPAARRDLVAADALRQLARELWRFGLPYDKLLSFNQQTDRPGSDEPATMRLVATVGTVAAEVELDDARKARDDYRDDRDRWHDRATELRDALASVLDAPPAAGATRAARAVLEKEPTC